MSGFFTVTDGTIRIHLANDHKGGWHMVEWVPLAPPAQNLWQASPFSDGQQIAMRKYGLTADYLKLHAEADCMDITIRLVQDLRRLLTKAVDYWASEWTTEPVWLEVQGDGETNTRYAYVYNFDMPHDDDPFMAPFGALPSVMEEIELTIEHSWWLNSLSGACVEISAQQTYHQLPVPVSFVPLALSDDCYVDQSAGPGVIHLNSTSLKCGLTFDVMNPYASHIGIRFSSVTIPPGALISSAYIQFEGSAADAGDVMGARIYGEDDSHPNTYNTYADFMARPHTTAFVDWDNIGHWVDTGLYNTPDLSTIIQEIVNRADWVSGHNLGIQMWNHNSDLDAFREASATDRGRPYNPPELFITYYIPNAINFGRAETCLREVYFANKHTIAQLTHIFVYDQSAGTFSTNRIGAATPFNLFPAVPAVGDYIVFIIDTSAPDSGPFGSLVFDLTTIQTNITGIDWEYWDGAWNNTFPVQDNTNANGAMTGVAFDTLGVNSVSFDHPAGWITGTFNGVTGYAVRAIITSIGGGPTPPAQNNRNIYSVVVPFIDIAYDQILGDAAALARLKLYSESYDISNGVIRTIFGLRSLSRGSHFSAYINLADIQNPTGITITPVAGGSGGGSFANDILSPTGRCIDHTVVVTTFLPSCDIQLNAPISTEYCGRYRVFLRGRQDNTGDTFDFYMTIWNEAATNIYFTSKINSITFISNGFITDLGLLEIPRSPVGDWSNLNIRLYVRTNNTGTDMHLYDLILIPCDEILNDFSGLNEVDDEKLDLLSYLDINPVSQPKLYNPATARTIVSTYNLRSWKSRGISPLMLQSNAAQRIWFLMLDDMSSVTERNVPILSSAELFALWHYFTERGDR